MTKDVIFIFHKIFWTINFDFFLLSIFSLLVEIDYFYFSFCEKKNDASLSLIFEHFKFKNKHYLNLNSNSKSVKFKGFAYLSACFVDKSF